MKVKQWKGLISHRNIEAYPSDWLNEWHSVAKEADEKGNELVVFEIPKDKTGTTDLRMIDSIQATIDFILNVRNILKKQKS